VIQPRFVRLLQTKTLRLVAGLALVAISTCVIGRFLPARAFANDFSMAYLGARAMAQGLDPYTLSLNEYARDQALPIRGAIHQATNPPVLLWMLRPLAMLPVNVAFWLYVAVEFAALIISVVVAYRMLGQRLSIAGRYLAVGLLCCSMPMFAHFWFSQVQLPLLALVMVGALALRAGRSRSAALLFTLAAALKLFPAPLALWPGLALRGRQRWVLLGWTALFGLGWVALPGWARWDSFHRHGLPLLSAMVSGEEYYNFTVTSLVSGLLRGTTWGQPVGTVISVALILLAVWKCSRRSLDSDASLCLLLVASVMCSMVAWVHYFVWLFYPLCVVAAEARQATRQRRVWLLALVLGCIGGFNTAYAFADRALGSLNGCVPLLLMALLYVHFFRAPE
jgi:hypothetical protein